MPYLIATIVLIAMIVVWRSTFRTAPRLVPGNLDWARVPTTYDRSQVLAAVQAEPQLLPVGRIDQSRGVIVLDATPEWVAGQIEGQPRTFGFWVFVVVQPFADEGSLVRVGALSKWFTFGRTARLIRTHIRDRLVRELWRRLPPPPPHEPTAENATADSGDQTTPHL